ncbi:MAG: hypothetical protein JGK24_07310 [Microcoleus sp. PH2017_29_MFU_D_A]|jgi:hypothetical protein|uniref:hypothetical protein n=1 Tax=unclassified Microcoleus TaxID=2642155 RepID=UPI001E09AE32|nr:MULTISPECIES: hypothetical protein [unclassified Microcoleus]MCC3416532.1 hypothetical protein [Microcoleus sp. PH2017_07_MST_O_A]MCC3431231.1 hypothetical protein [Microcoleus sp. PH2017_04_SCI_O_A]MCC3441068.1 hypothetical protein [Microcoleus sp. PH2017_03_ELD_O_A]MCC3467176.1 hypothetical protein [Microcoleus sp. PH2017_06_SFM_O_A]MCC3504937.1 hypothetical protein [Microcoleus sp. PH2017_19_SFW_U_A]MCC3510320.1 hypothetical protein [Microcoleus sp. PH2017_17_BER_D_A]TAE10595.1 MAG: hy
MAQNLTLCDEYGIIYEAMKILPDDELKISFLEALAELEDQECHRTRQFPKTRLHKVKGVKQAVYRADIDKVSGWRIHVQYVNGQIHLKDIIEGQRHDNVIEVIKSKKSRYQ